jgi:hypothetical protein
MPPDISGNIIVQAYSHGLQVLSRAEMPPGVPDGVESELSPLLAQVLVPGALEQFILSDDQYLPTFFRPVLDLAKGNQTLAKRLVGSFNGIV